MDTNRHRRGHNTAQSSFATQGAEQSGVQVNQEVLSGLGQMNEEMVYQTAAYIVMAYAERKKTIVGGGDGHQPQQIEVIQKIEPSTSNLNLLVRFMQNAAVGGESDKEEDMSCTLHSRKRINC